MGKAAVRLPWLVLRRLRRLQIYPSSSPWWSSGNTPDPFNLSSLQFHTRFHHEFIGIFQLQVHTFQKACVAVYPSIVQNGIVWFWPNTDPEYKDILTKKKPPYIPQLDDPSFTFQMFNRDIPYGYSSFNLSNCLLFNKKRIHSSIKRLTFHIFRYEILIENLMDPAHVPYAHYGIMRMPQPR